MKDQIADGGGATESEKRRIGETERKARSQRTDGRC